MRLPSASFSLATSLVSTSKAKELNSELPRRETLQIVTQSGTWNLGHLEYMYFGVKWLQREININRCLDSSQAIHTNQSDTADVLFWFTKPMKYIYNIFHFVSAFGFVGTCTAVTPVIFSRSNGNHSSLRLDYPFLKYSITKFMRSCFYSVVWAKMKSPGL